MKYLINAALVASAVPALAGVGRTLCHYVAYDAAFWPKERAVNAAEYRKFALDGYKNVPCDTLVFSPMFAFGSAAANIPSADYPKWQPAADSRWMSRWKNGMAEFLKTGTDPTAETVKWCRENKKSPVAAIPVNFFCTHSGKPSAKESPGSWRSYLWPSFKTANPDALFDAEGKNLPYGSGNCVDYSSDKVRAKFVANASDLVGKYDLDAILVDFMWNPSLFRSVAGGDKAGAKELGQITDMMTKIKAACKAASARLGHKVDLIARVPDSVGYAKDIGIDLQVWLDTKLLDRVVLGGWFQLNRWNAVGDLALKAGIPWYASFTTSGIYVFNDSGYHGDDERLPRQSREVCRARMADAMLCKAEGCMFTMGNHWDVALNSGHVVPFDPAVNRTADKRYFVSFTNDRSAGSYLKDGVKYRTIPSLVSGAPVDVSKKIEKYSINVWEDFAALKKDGILPQVILATEIVVPSGIETAVTFNGKEYKPFKKRAGVQYYEVPVAAVKTGANEVTVKAKGQNKRHQTAQLGNIAVEVKYPQAKGGK